MLAIIDPKMLTRPKDLFINKIYMQKHLSSKVYHKLSLLQQTPSYLRSCPQITTLEHPTTPDRTEQSAHGYQYYSLRH
jgi:hypothetical protein